MASTFNLNSILPQQASMSAADNPWGMSLPETVYEDRPLVMQTSELESLPDEPDEPQFSAVSEADNTDELLRQLLQNTGYNAQQPDEISKALANVLGNADAYKEKAFKDMYIGAVYKTAAAASDFFTRATGILAGQTSIIHGQRDVAIQNYQNQMDALDNQVLYIKNQLLDRFNQIVDTNIMKMAAKNLRVTSGNVLELSKKEAQEITEDMRMTESNARIKQLALQAGQEKAKEASKYAIKQMWTGLFGSAMKLGLAVGTAGGTGESWGNLYAGYYKNK